MEPRDSDPNGGRARETEAPVSFTSVPLELGSRFQSLCGLMVSELLSFPINLCEWAESRLVTDAAHKSEPSREKNGPCERGAFPRSCVWALANRGPDLRDQRQLAADCGRASHALRCERTAHNSRDPRSIVTLICKPPPSLGPLLLHEHQLVGALALSFSFDC